MLGRRFLSINGVSIPNPESNFKTTFDEDETVNLSEAGTELVRIRRLDKRTFSGTWHLSSFWLAKFEEWATSPVVILRYKGRTYNVRMRGFAPQLYKNSEYVTNSEGLWTVSPTFTEI